ncbi:hypothetical protein QO002_001121 [Pararhizobium capsulatum DSM 1112]|uniref:Transposase n=1 Tax=Pararhizobium capsulatum DSM 1112 TaxID=1121113 RepID=A0ABU0BM33_9HYPH|nr:hypothetical protein [Pararhizobium capsulatum DSM 1112]
MAKTKTNLALICREYCVRGSSIGTRSAVKRKGLDNVEHQRAYAAA